jgi:hypothetical protein
MQKACVSGIPSSRSGFDGSPLRLTENSKSQFGSRANVA